MSEYIVAILVPSGASVVFEMKANDPDEICHKLTQRYGDEWKLLGCKKTGEGK